MLLFKHLSELQRDFGIINTKASGLTFKPEVASDVARNYPFDLIFAHAP